MLCSPGLDTLTCKSHALVVLEALTLAVQAANRAMWRVTSEKEYKPLASVDHHKLQALDADNRRAQQHVHLDAKAACEHVLIMRQPYLHTLHFCNVASHWYTILVSSLD